MKKTSLFIVGLSLAMHLQAQKNAEKLALKPGQKFSLQGSDSSATAQKMGDQPMNMTTLTNALTEFEVISQTQNGFLLKSTLSKIKVDFEGFGQKMVFDSEDPKKQEGMMAEQLKGKIGSSDTLEIGFDGSVIEDEDKDKDKKKGRGRGGMMRMMDMQSGSVENVFLLVPNEAKVGQGWKADKTKDGIKSQTIYFVESIEGDVAKVSFKRKKKGTRTMKGQQGEMNMDIDNLSSGLITVNLSTGMVSSYMEDADSNTKMKAMDKDITTSGKTVSRIEVK